MTDQIYIFDGSRKYPVSETTQVLDSLKQLRPLEYFWTADTLFIDAFVNRAKNPQNGRVDVDRLVNDFHKNSFVQRINPKAGKIIIIDEDIFSRDSETGREKWGLGVGFPMPGSLGYILQSTFATQTPAHLREVVKHELGHIFGAAKPGRRNTYECQGSHCIDPACIMHQRTNPAEYFTQNYQRMLKGEIDFCNLCKEDIRRFTI